MSQPGDAGAEPGTTKRHSIWPAIHPRLLELIREHRSTILFVNSRRLAERLAGALNGLAGEPLVRAHHGSIAREERLEIEEALKAGRLPAMVATSSLELGIDMGAVDLVIQIETPPSVASGMQRIGRASHQAGAVSRGIIFPKFRGDLLATAAITRAMQQAEVEATRVPKNPLDVLAQQLVSIVATGERSVDELFALVRRAAPFARLPRGQFDGVLDMLSGRYPSDAFAELRPRLTWDRLRGTVKAREGAKRLAVTNAGTIPDRGLFGVYLLDAPERGGRRVGELDEEMVFESQVGDVFVLGASSWRVAEITRDRVFVVPAPGQPGRMPFWKGDRVSRPVDLGRAIGKLTRTLLGEDPERALVRLEGDHALDRRAGENLLQYLIEQRQVTGSVPDDRTLVLERTRDELGDWRLCLLSPFGGRVHAPLTLAIAARLKQAGEAEVETLWSDDGIVVRLPDRERPPAATDLLPPAGRIEQLVLGELEGTALFAGSFREAAGRALLLPRRRPGQRTPLWMQRKRAHDLLGVATRFPSFPIVLEAYRECLQDVFDLPALIELAHQIERREVRLVTVDTGGPSPFSASLLFGYVANYLYDGDTPLHERRAQALSVDQRQLRELLGEAELRELLSADVLQQVELGLQALSPAARARGVDRLHDLLLRLGDLTGEELPPRCDPPEKAQQWLAELLGERRVIALRVAGEERFVAVEDASRYREALGTPLPAGLPSTFLVERPDALEGLMARYARTHGPFTAREAAARFGLGTAPVEAALRRLLAEGGLLEGEFRPGGHGREWCDASVLGTLRRRSLAALRKQVEPADPASLQRLLLDWHGVSGASPRRSNGGPEDLLEVVEQLQGVALPASALESEILPARLPGYRPMDLDTLCAAGEVVWVGAGALGERDGRIALYLAEQFPLLAERDAPPTEGELPSRLRAHLGQHGASFFPALHAAAGGGLQREVLDALWDLVWAGEVTNDTPGALRAFLLVHSPRVRARRVALSAFRSRRDAPPSAAGRWSLVPRPPKAPTPTERLRAQAEQLLERHGVLTRSAVASESVAGSFAALYPVLRALEEAGRIRRGYFVTGLGGSQFAHPAALDRLRELGTPSDDDGGVMLAATDPANAYGAALPWPAEIRGARAAGAHVILVDGRLAAYLGKGGDALALQLPGDEPARSHAAGATARALADWARRTGRRFFGELLVNGEPLARSALAPFLAESGFTPAGGGLRLPTTPRSQA